MVQGATIIDDWIAEGEARGEARGRVQREARGRETEARRWFLAEELGHRKETHGGGLPGWSAEIAHYPDDRLTAIALGNTDSGHVTPSRRRSRSTTCWRGSRVGRRHRREKQASRALHSGKRCGAAPVGQGSAPSRNA
jgi:hypothetical protein